MDSTSKIQNESFIESYASFNQNVSVFDFGKVIVLNNYKENQHCRIVSGGTSCHIEFVGTGMLTASIQGENRAPPTPSIILRTIRELSINHIMGILVIVQSSSDTLNFGLAVERAFNDDLRVTLLKVDDPTTGIVLVNKIAGALAMKHITMSQIFNFCQEVNSNLASNGTNVKRLMLTNRECDFCTKCDTQIDREYGVTRKATIKKKVIQDLIPQIIEEMYIDISQKLPLQSDDMVVVLVNNTGALAQNEQFEFFKYLTNYLHQQELTIGKFYIGPYLTLNNGTDLNLTILKVFDKQILTLLDEPCSTTGWRANIFQHQSIGSKERVLPGCLRRKCRLSPAIKGMKLENPIANIVMLCLQFACDALISCEKMLNKMDLEWGNGENGTKLRVICELLNKKVCSQTRLNIDYPFTFLLTLSKYLEKTIGGTIGCLYAIMFEGAARTFENYKPEESDVVGHTIWIEALENACKSIERCTNHEEFSLAILEPLKACVTTFRNLVNIQGPIAALGAGVARVEMVASMTKLHGKIYPNPNAHAVGIWMRAVFEAIKFRSLE